MLSKKLNIAILGTRGIPARYGGFETFAEELSTRLVENGHRVTVYGRRSFGSKPVADREYRGVRLRTVPTALHKYLETPLHALVSLADAWTQKFDVILLCNAANSPFAWLARLRGIPVLINVDGIERLRSKWSKIGKLWYRIGERCAVLFASKIVADAQVIAKYYRDEYRAQSQVIAYGATERHVAAGSKLAEFGLSPGRYLLYVSRLEPENNALGVIQAYRKVTTDMPLVIVGDAPYAANYKAQLRSAADARVIFAGYQFADDYRELRSNCYLYIQASEVGGTHPALVEAMIHGNCILANRVPEHVEVLGEAGLYYERNDFSDLAKQLQELIAAPEVAARYGELARERAKLDYNWDRVTRQYEELFAGVAR